ncbi:MAG: ATP synthase F1 subunit epsilon [Actinomycetes bacterium]
MAMRVELVSPERVLFQGDADMVVARTANGEIAFLPGHVPFLGALGIAKVRVIQSDGEVVAAVHGGFVEAGPNGVTVLSDVAELAEQVDVVRARTALEAAEARLRSDAEDAEAKAALQRASVRLDAAGQGTPTAH